MKHSFRVLVVSALVLSVAASLTACSSPEDKVHEFAAWAGEQKYVTSVDAHAMSGELGAYGLNAHLAVDGAIDDAALVSLANSAAAKAESLGISYPDIYYLVDDAWGFSLYDDANVKVINQLRHDQLFVAATLNYVPLVYTGDYPFGLHGTVATADQLEAGKAALTAAARDNGLDVDKLSIGVSIPGGS